MYLCYWEFNRIIYMFLADFAFSRPRVEVGESSVRVSWSTLAIKLLP
jgi:hypothetical protein